jgi:hypothetical protein
VLPCLGVTCLKPSFPAYFPVGAKDEDLAFLNVNVPSAKYDESLIGVYERPAPCPVFTSCAMGRYELLAIHV